MGPDYVFVRTPIGPVSPRIRQRVLAVYYDRLHDRLLKLRNLTCAKYLSAHEHASGLQAAGGMKLMRLAHPRLA